jgi:nitrogenase-associated protein
MKFVIFYEKPGCSTNSKQKQSLERAGCILIVKNLLENEMSLEELSTYLENRPVHEWFNPNAPALKNGEIDPYNYKKEEALALLFYNPILIRRPLISIEGHKICGFDKKKIEDILCIKLDIANEEKCTSKTACPTPVTATST